jgi:hypothetical protein
VEVDVPDSLQYAHELDVADWLSDNYHFLVQSWSKVLPPKAFKKGDVVFANRVLLDGDGSEWRIAAIHGDLGVVNDYGQTSPSVDVSWYNGSQCTVHEDWIDLYQGGVQKVVD